MKESFEEILRKNELKVTGPRLNVLDIVASREAAVSQPTLEKMVGKDIDRVTLYRILKTFEEKGILHKVIDLNGTANYAICSSSCTKHAHHDEHFHFNCTNCLNVYCMNDFHLPALKMPQGFTAQSVNLAITGICKYCNEVV
jgi:Fur family ferric uptake transcriptional regulator